MALLMNYLLAQIDGFEINRTHLQRVFRGRIGQDRIKAALAALAREGYIIAQKPERHGGRITQKPSRVSHAKCVYAGRTEGVNTTPPVSTPTSTTMKELEAFTCDLGCGRTLYKSMPLSEKREHLLTFHPDSPWALKLRERESA